MTEKQYIITAKDLTKKYKDFIAVDNVSFEVGQGEIFGFLGPNGAGKTTTIKILTTILKPTSGYIALNGFDPVKNFNEARGSFGIVFQDQSLDEELTAWENMYFHAVLYKVAREERKQKIEHLMRFVELWDRKNELVKNFSGGMRRRLEIARGLLHHPKILFLDEPTLGLDPQTRNHIWGYIKNLNKEEGVTVFFTTHYMEEAERVADKIAVIDYGKIIARGSVEELKQQTGAHTLEEAFLSLTGRDIRAESATGIDGMRMHRKMWRR